VLITVVGESPWAWMTPTKDKVSRRVNPSRKNWALIFFIDFCIMENTILPGEENLGRITPWTYFI
jgi:hypothetical protein